MAFALVGTGKVTGASAANPAVVFDNAPTAGQMVLLIVGNTGGITEPSSVGDGTNTAVRWDGINAAGRGLSLWVYVVQGTAGKTWTANGLGSAVVIGYVLSGGGDAPFNATNSTDGTNGQSASAANDDGGASFGITPTLASLVLHSTVSGSALTAAPFTVASTNGTFTGLVNGSSGHPDYNTGTTNMLVSLLLNGTASTAYAPHHSWSGTARSFSMSTKGLKPSGAPAAFNNFWANGTGAFFPPVVTATTAALTHDAVAPTSVNIVTEVGVVYGTSPNPTIAGGAGHLACATTTFSNLTVTGLSPSTTYYYGSYVITTASATPQYNYAVYGSGTTASFTTNFSVGLASMFLTRSRNAPACLSEIISPTCLTASGCNGGADCTNLPRKLGSKAVTGRTVWVHRPGAGVKAAW